MKIGLVKSTYLRDTAIDRCFVSGNGPRCKRSERMLAVEHYELIRHKILNEGKSRQDAANSSTSVRPEPRCQTC